MNFTYENGYKDALNGGEFRAGVEEHDYDYINGFAAGMDYIAPFFTNREPQIDF